MYCRSEYARLCRLINDSLRPYAEPQPLPPLTQEKEKDLLIILSEVSREIRHWQDEHDSNSQHEIVVNPEFEDKFFLGMEPASADHHNCLANIVAILVIFLTVESQYVRHTTGNVLVVISNFLSKHGGKLDEFLHLLCVCLEVAMSKILSSSSVSLITGAAVSDSDTSSFILFLRQRLVNANWFTMDGLVQVLRTILKHLKQDHDGELIETYMHSVSYCLTNIPWDLLNENHVTQTTDARKSSVMDLQHGKIGSSLSKFLFLGTLLQFLCSLVEQSSYVEIRGGSLGGHLFLDKITSLVPKLLCWGFCKQEDYNLMHISQYLRHKMLMLMIRLSFQIRQECSTLVLWLQLLRKYFEDLLHQSKSGCYSGLDESLEGSPFLACVADGGQVNRISTRHLQRQAVFLFLKCSFSLISLSKETDTKCSCATSHSCLTCELQSGLECCAREKCLSELSVWLQRHVPLEMFVDYEMYLEKCGNFALSFLQLYMDEDDLLFEVLLQLLSLPFPSEQMGYKEKGKGFEIGKGDIIFHLSNIFSPIHLFHLFLAELHYDHQVLLDYLISKDTGIQCVQYLLRCLRTVSKSWHLFVGFQGCGEETSWSSFKKRKVSPDSPDSHEKIVHPFTPDKRGSNPVLRRESGSVLNYTRQRAFENAKECLLSLKRSVENLHQKDLFPYNPTALLRSFTSFQEICREQEKVYLPNTEGMT